MGRARHEERRRQAPQRSYPRAARLNALLHEVLADELERIADNDDRLGLLTLTGVACEPDLRHAVVFVASLSDEARGALEDHRRELQAAVGAQVRTRRVPTLSFEADPAIEAARRVEEALRRAREHDATMPPPTGAGEEVGGAADDPDRAGTGRAAAPERPTPAPGSP
jgi:ribosome-binding factor A